MTPTRALSLVLRPVEQVLSLTGPATVLRLTSDEALCLDFAPVLRGERGQPGPAGDATVLRTSAAPISALRGVWEDAAGVVHLLDYRDAEHIELLAGITVTATSAAGQPVTVQRAGVIDLAGLGLAPGSVWLGIGGALTQTPPDDGFDVLVGAVVSDSRLILNLQDSIALE